MALPGTRDYGQCCFPPTRERGRSLTESEQAWKPGARGGDQRGFGAQPRTEEPQAERASLRAAHGDTSVRSLGDPSVAGSRSREPRQSSFAPGSHQPAFRWAGTALLSRRPIDWRLTGRPEHARDPLLLRALRHEI